MNFFQRIKGTIYKGRLNRTTIENSQFAAAHAQKNILMLPPFSYEEIEDGKGYLDHDIQMCNLEQLLNRMIIDNGRQYTINAVLNLIKTTR